MALAYSTLRKPLNAQVVDPSTGRMREEWVLYFGDLTTRLNATVGELTADAAPASRNLTAGAGLTGGGDLTADRTFAVGAGTGITVNANDVAISVGGVGTTELAGDSVTNAKLANMAQSTIKGRAVSAGTGDPTDLTTAQATAILDPFTSALKGLAPASGGGTANFLRADGTWNVPPGVPAWTTVSKANFESRTSTTTLANDTDLQFSMAANTNYRVRMKVFFDFQASSDFKFALTGPASPNAVTVVRKQITSSAPTTLAPTIETSYTASTSILTSGGTRGYLEFDIHIRNGSNSGTFAFQWAQVTSTADPAVVLESSYLEYGIA